MVINKLTNSKKIFALLMITQILAIVVLAIVIHKKNSSKSVLGATSVSPLNKSDFIFKPDSDLKYYMVFAPNYVNDFRYWDGSTLTYTINKDGINDRFDYDIEKNPNTFRIITLGDSFTFGSYVNTKDNWTEGLEDLLNANKTCSNIKKFEVINLGMRGFDIPYIAKRYAEIGSKYNPDLIIWFESGTGFYRDNEILYPYLKACQDSIDSTLSQKVHGEKYVKCWGEANDKVYSNKDANTVISNYIDKGLANFYNTRGTTSVAFIGFSNLTNEDNNKFLNYIKNRPNAYETASVSDIYSIKATFPDGHPNLLGHKIIANDIYKYITSKSELGISCNSSN